MTQISPAYIGDVFNRRIVEGTFVKLSLGNYKGAEQELKQIFIKPVRVKRTTAYSFTYRYKTRDIVKNYSLEEAASLLADQLDSGFGVATIFSTEGDDIFEHLSKGWRHRLASPTCTAVPDVRHDHEKSRKITVGGKPYLAALGIADGAGNVKKDAQDKFKQINRYVELLDPLITEAGTLSKVADMGSGKGYLTFALYDHLVNNKRLNVEVTGVEFRPDLVEVCNNVAKESNFMGLRFQEGTIQDFDATGTDLLIALHACDTATDDAIFKGVTAGAKLIVVAPCCHKEVRREMSKSKPANDVSFLTRYGILMERQAEMVTDGLRAQLLEYAGYTTSIFEFVSGVHTPKNLLLVGIKGATPAKDRTEILNKIRQVTETFGIKRQQLYSHFVSAGMIPEGV